MKTTSNSGMYVPVASLKLILSPRASPADAVQHGPQRSGSTMLTAQCKRWSSSQTPPRTHNRRLPQVCISQNSLRAPSTVYLFTTLLLFAAFVNSSTAAPTQSGTETEDDNYNYYYHHTDNNNFNGMSTEYVSDWSHEWAKASGRIQQPKCVDIPSNMTLCHNIGYEKMLLPNLLEHDSLDEVVQQAGSWVPLARINCHPDTKVFLCSLFSPVCLDRRIYPCRSLCEQVRGSCESRMLIHGFGWPEMLKCDKFPLDNDMCIMPIHDVKPDNNCTACKHPQTHESLIDHYCRSDVAMRVTSKSTKPNGPDMELVLRKKRKLYRFENIEKKEARTLPVVISGGASCVCDTINGTQGTKYLLMGSKRGDRIVINFAMQWKRKDKEFRKGLRAIRKGDCKELLKTVIDGHIREEDSNSSKKDRKRKKKGRKGKKGSKKGKKGKRRKGKKGKKGRRKNGKKGKKDRDEGNKVNKRNSKLSKSEVEDRVLLNLKNAAN